MNNAPQGASCSPESLLLYHYGELPQDERLQVERHLQGCAACRRELVDLQAALELLPAIDPELPPETIRSFQARVSRRLGTPRPRGKVVLGWSLAASAAMLLTLTLRPQLPTPAPSREAGGVEAILRLGGDPGGLPDPELLLYLELLEHLDLLQGLRGVG